MADRFIRTEALIGKEAFAKLKGSRIAVFGVGGVGGYAAEALARSGVGHIALIDNDIVAKSNINRQIIATDETIGIKKVAAAKARIESINPSCVVEVYDIFYMPQTHFDFSQFDYIIDAVDTVTAKLSIIENANKAGVPIISCMGTGNKLHPELLEISDIHKTSVCPLARVMRNECRKRGIKKLKVVYSKEKPIEQHIKLQSGEKPTPASIAFVPASAGLMMAGAVINDLIK